MQREVNTDLDIPQTNLVLCVKREGAELVPDLSQPLRAFQDSSPQLVGRVGT